MKDLMKFENKQVRSHWYAEEEKWSVLKTRPKKKEASWLQIVVNRATQMTKKEVELLRSKYLSTNLSMLSTINPKHTAR